MQYSIITYGVSKYGEGCDWECIDGGAQIIFTGGITRWDEVLSIGKICCCWDRSHCKVFSFVVVGTCCIPGTAVLFVVAVGWDKHWFLELGLLVVPSNVFREDVLPGTIIIRCN